MEFTKKITPEFLSGGGEMGELIRNYKWSHTSIGDFEQWPQSLRTTVSIILNSKFPMFLFWGEELICFYNDAYRPSLGNNGKHPYALGKPAEEIWPEIWNIIHPLIVQVLAGGEATWSEDQLIPIYRNGKIEDVYWTFSYSPVKDESGHPAGVFITCTETTEKIANLQQLEESNDQLQFAIEATELGTWDLDPVTNKFTGNNRLKIWFGLPDEAEIDLILAINVIAEKDRTKVTEAIQKALLYSSGGGYDVEYTIVHPVTKTERIVRAKGRAWFNNDKICYRFNGTLQDISEQASARKNIEESEERFRQLADNSPMWVWMADKNASLTYSNKELLNFVGFSDYKDFTAQAWEKVIHPDDIQMVYKIFEDAYINQKSYSFECRFINAATGEYEWVMFKGVPRMEQKKVSGFIGTGLNINQEKIQMEALRESSEKFETLLEAIPQMTWTNLPDGDVNFYNQKWYNYTGLDYEQTKGWGWKTVVHPEDLPGTVKDFTEALQTGKIFVTENRYKRSDGSYRWHLNRALPVKNEKDEIVLWVGTATDIHDLKQIENALKESEGRFRMLAETLPQLVWVTDEKGNADFTSGRWKEYTGIEPSGEEEWKAVIHPDDLENINNAWMHSLTTGSIYRCEVRMKSKTGEYRWHAAYGEPVFDADNKIIKWIGAFTDIEELKKLDQQKNEFISIASHELKTPLTSIKGYTQLLEMVLDEMGNEKASLFLSKTKLYIEQLNTLIEDLLDVSKIEAGKLQFNFTKFNFDELVFESVENMAIASADHFLEIHGKANMQFYGDRNRLEQVFTNLLSNAIKYSPDADRVIISVSGDNQEIKVSIQDFGIGIAEPHMSKIFESFYRVETSENKFSGLGIGLKICAEIIKRHGGDLSLKSKLLEGATFTFTLPVHSSIKN
ncbi:MAG: PAS domain-containing protein [Chitinophagales bacterium]|nr:PAS domain-containing protein [Chitinophagales bacterium]